MTDSQSQSEYSGRLQEIRKRLRASKSVSTSKLQSQLAETIEKNDYRLHQDSAMASAGTDVQAQRMVLNKIIDEHFKGKKYNDTVVDFKKLIKSYPHVISFYLFMAEFYRILDQDKHADMVLNHMLDSNPGASAIKQKMTMKLLSKEPIVKFEVSENVSEFETIIQRRRHTIAPKFRRESTDDEDVDGIRNNPIRREENLKPNPKKPKGVQFQMKENVNPTSTDKLETPAKPRARSDSIKTPSNIKTPKHRQSTGRRVLSVNNTEYEILEKLGQGGFSRVYKCMANGTDDIRALKYVDLQQVDQTSEEGIKNEVEHLQSLRGERNIIQMFDYAVVERKMYIVLEYGELDMQKYLHENKGFIDNWQLKSLWRQMVNAVAIVHSKGIIHRDLKPCNFMICRGQMKLIDFGIANSISADATSLSTDMVGTLNYMSPEQLNETAEGSKSVKVGKRSDSWSLGCILYLMAYGKLPFQHIKHNAVKIAKIIDEAHQIEFSPHSCDGLVQMLQICLNRKPKSRLLPQDILGCFFYGGVIQMVKYLDDNQFQELYKTVNKLAG